MKKKFKLRFSLVATALLLPCSLQLFGAWTDQKPDSSPVTTDSSTCRVTTSGTCHKEQVDSCRCVDCPGLQEDLPGCDCVQTTGNAYWQAWDGRCVGTYYPDVDFGLGYWLYECEWPSEPQQSGDKANKPNCGRAS
jgi:hypothetical protein